MRSSMTLDEAIDIAWGIDKLHAGARPTPQEALERIDRQLATCGFKWLTGQEARWVLREACKQSIIPRQKKPMAKTTLTVDVEYDDQVTDPESIASAADRLMETVLSTPGIMEEYADPRFGEFFVLSSAAGAEPDLSHARRRWVLYDMGGDELLGTRVYNEHAEAVEDAAQADDVLVLPLAIPRQRQVNPGEEPGKE